MTAELEKLDYLRGMDTDTLDLSFLQADRHRFLASLGRRLRTQNVARRDDDRKSPILLTLVVQSMSWTRRFCCSTRRCPSRTATARERLT